MKTYLGLKNHRLENITFFLLLALYFATSCSTFKKGYECYKDNKCETCNEYFLKSSHQSKWQLASRFYIEKVNLCNPRKRYLLQYHQSDSTLRAAFKEMMNIESELKKRRLKKYAVKTDTSLLVEIQKKAVAYVRSSEKVADLDTLLYYFTQWVDPKSLDKFADSLVNAKVAEAFKSTLNPINCNNFSNWKITYDDATRIMRNHTQRVNPDNWPTFLKIKHNIWTIFCKNKESYCNMEMFQIDHPEHPYSQDPYFHEAKMVLCSSSLKDGLQFIAKNPYSEFENEIIKHIWCNKLNEDKNLDSSEKELLADILEMIALSSSLCENDTIISDESQTKFQELAIKYYDRRIGLNLIVAGIDQLIHHDKLKEVKTVISNIHLVIREKEKNEIISALEDERLSPLKQYFQKYLIIINGITKYGKIKSTPVEAWNSELDEFSAVSWGEGEEVYFVRKGPDGIHKIMSSQLEEETWSSPFEIEELNFSADVVPLSISDNGLWLLLSSGGKLWQSLRPSPSFGWTKPELIPINLPVITRASFFSEKNILIEGIKDINWPFTDLFVCTLGKKGRFGELIKLDSTINSDFFDDTYPNLVAGRRLFFASHRPEGGFGIDNYVAMLSETPGFKVDTTILLRWDLNTTRDDSGFSSVLEKGIGFMDRTTNCGGDMDIYQVKMTSIIDPEELKSESVCDLKRVKPIIRLTGVVLDENGKTVSGEEGGFMEFTTDYNLKVSQRKISKNGTFSCIVPTTAKVIRLFPEVPGYYSERDTAHFLELYEADHTFQDTFKLISFDYLRKNIKLVYSTFYHGTSEFDDKTRAYPELVRLAKIVRRMGAKIELIGHTDDVGKDDVFNKELSYQRAKSVKLFLVNTCGFDENDIEIKGFGASVPKCPNDTEEGRRCNRRVEVILKMPEVLQDQQK